MKIVFFQFPFDELIATPVNAANDREYIISIHNPMLILSKICVKPFPVKPHFPA